jgi:hypothetical protein
MRCAHVGPYILQARLYPTAAVNCLLMAPPETGRYIITNRKYLNVVILHDANDRSEIVAGNREDNNPGQMVLQMQFNSWILDSPLCTVAYYSTLQQEVLDSESRS